MFEGQLNRVCHPLINQQPGYMRPTGLAIAGILLQLFGGNPDAQPVKLCKNFGIPCFSPFLRSLSRWLKRPSPGLKQ